MLCALQLDRWFPLAGEGGVVDKPRGELRVRLQVLVKGFASINKTL